MNIDLEPKPRKIGSSFPKAQENVPVLLALLAVLLVAGAAHAGEGWNYAVDAAALADNTYVGSDEYYFVPVPAFRATRNAGATTWFISLPLEGIGVSHRYADSGLTGSVSMNFGGCRNPEEYSVVGIPTRHGDRTLALLAGTPEVATPVVLEAKVEYPAPFGLLGAALGYHPTTVEYEQIGIDDELRHGFLLSVQYTALAPVTGDFLIGGVLGLELMDGNYAEGWFAVAQETKSLARFDADAGVRDVQAALFASYQVAARVNLSLYYRNMLLLGDAAECPATLDEHQQTVLFRTSYAF
jgi:outer membrane scaffolding protein for murein synthesis (MipA/OmpV family)